MDSMKDNDIKAVFEYLKSHSFSSFNDVPVEIKGQQYFIKMIDEFLPMGTYLYYARKAESNYYFVGHYEDFN